MISAVLPPDDDSKPHTVLSLHDVDELHTLNRRILLRSTVVSFVLDEQQPQDDDSDFPMLSLLREALQELVVDVRLAAKGIDALMHRAERAEKGGA
jgi:hypothetical protein